MSYIGLLHRLIWGYGACWGSERARLAGSLSQLEPAMCHRQCEGLESKPAQCSGRMGFAVWERECS